MLTQIDDLGVSGISGVEWDAVELPSQFMENFCWEWDVVERLTAHVDTGAALPRALFDRMLAARNFHSGLRHAAPGRAGADRHAAAHRAGRRAARGADRRPGRRRGRGADAARVRPASLHTFTHIFDGGYAAGYYSYKWAEVLSADAWSAFEESAGTDAGVLNVETGRRYRQAVLETGGSRPRSTASRRSAAASRASTPCCATRGWADSNSGGHPAPSGTRSGGARLKVPAAWGRFQHHCRIRSPHEA